MVLVSCQLSKWLGWLAANQWLAGMVGLIVCLKVQFQIAVSQSHINLSRTLFIFLGPKRPPQITLSVAPSVCMSVRQCCAPNAPFYFTCYVYKSALIFICPWIYLSKNIALYVQIYVYIYEFKLIYFALYPSIYVVFHQLTSESSMFLYIHIHRSIYLYDIIYLQKNIWMH